MLCGQRSCLEFTQDHEHKRDYNNLSLCQIYFADKFILLLEI